MAFDARASKVRLVVLDVDGVLSDGSIVISGEGELFKSFNVRDGLGIKLLQKAGIEVAILTGRTSTIVARRAEELGMKRIEQGKLKKLPTLLKMLDDFGVSPEELAYMGDDLPDLPCLRIAGFAATPRNGNPDLTPYIHWRSVHDGGRGAVREMAEHILKSKGLWDTLMDELYLSEGC